MGLAAFLEFQELTNSEEAEMAVISYLHLCDPTQRAGFSHNPLPQLPLRMTCPLPLLHLASAYSLTWTSYTGHTPPSDGHSP